MLKLRNAVEAVVLVTGISIPVLKITAFSVTTRIIILCITALPVGLIAVIGIGGESISSFVLNFLKFARNRRIIHRTGIERDFSSEERRKFVSDIGDLPEEFDDRVKTKNKKLLKNKDVKSQSINEYLPFEKIENGICYLKDRRYVKIIEVEPINFLLRSTREQRNIIYSYISYLKISPVKMQIKVISKKADIGKHLNKVKSEIEAETDEKCKVLLMDYYNLIKRIGLKEAVTRRFFIIFEYEPLNAGSKRNEEKDAISQLEIAERTARTYLNQCGNEVIEHENQDEFITEMLYILLNRKTSSIVPFEEHISQVIGKAVIIGGDLNNIPVVNFIAPENIDFKNGSYIYMDGIYHSYFIIPSDGYKTVVSAGWLSLLVNAGEGIDIDIFLSKQPKEKMQIKLGQQIRINRSKIKDASDTNTDFDDLDSAVRSGYFLKEGISNNQDFYYMNIMLTITAETPEDLQWRIN